jgi:hypothetical protein
MSWQNGTFTSIPTNIWSPSVPNGTYGTVTPTFGSFGHSNTTPQLTSGVTVVKGTGYVTYTDNSTGRWTTVSSNGLRSNG